MTVTLQEVCRNVARSPNTVSRYVHDIEPVVGHNYDMQYGSKYVQMKDITRNIRIAVENLSLKDKE